MFRPSRYRLLRVMTIYACACLAVIFGYRRLVEHFLVPPISAPIRMADEFLLASMGALFVFVWMRQVERSQQIEKHSAERLQTALDNAPESFGLVNADRRVEFVNRQATEVVGHPAAAIIGKTIFEILPPDTAEYIDGMTERVLASGTPEFGELLFPAPFGLVTLEVRAVPIHDERGHVAKVLFAAHDITERARAEEAIQRSERRYRSLVQNAADAVALTDAEGRLLPFSTFTATRVLGYEEGETDGGSLFDLVHPEDRAGAENVLRLLLAEPSKAITTSLRVLHKDGSWRWIEGVASNRLSDPDVAAIVINYSDVTERRTTEQRLELALAASKMGIWEWVGKTDRIYWSKECFEIFDIAAFDGRPETWWGMVHPDDLKEVWSKFEYSQAEKSSFSSEFRITRGDGEMRWVSNLGQCTFASDGTAVGVVGTVWDITERKQRDAERLYLLAQLRGLTGRLAEMDESGRQQIARELHDSVGQNLVALDLDLEVLRRLLPAESTPPAVTSRIEDATKLLSDVVDCIRHVLSDLRPPALDDLGLFAALQWHVDRFAERSEIRVDLQGSELEPRLPAPFETALFRIAQEALINVAQHAKANRVLVTLEDTEAGPTLSVEDDGVGIEQSGAPGWGLITMRERAESIGGRLLIESRSGAGTKVTVSLPANGN